jgi:hypothetical protein
MLQQFLHDFATLFVAISRLEPLLNELDDLVPPR